jgi:KipI family sensor histidine kinase inhibitor
LGESAVVLELEPPITLDSQRRIWGLAARLQQHEEVREVIPGMNNLTVLLVNPQHEALDAIERLQRWWEESEAVFPESRIISLPVVYGNSDGPDLAWVAEQAGMTEKQVVDCHSGATYDVYFLGFQPGFPYLGGLPERLAVPRRAEPRLKAYIRWRRLAVGRLSAARRLLCSTPSSPLPPCCFPAMSCVSYRKRREYVESIACRNHDRRAGWRPYRLP